MRGGICFAWMHLFCVEAFVLRGGICSQVPISYLEGRGIQLCIISLAGEACVVLICCCMLVRFFQWSILSQAFLLFRPSFSKRSRLLSYALENPCL